MYNKYIVLPLLALFILVAGLPSINLYHNLSLPEVSQHKIVSYYTWNFKYPIIHKNTIIYLGDEIKEQKYYSDIFNILSTANKGDEITFKLSGYGGHTQSATYLISLIKSTIFGVASSAAAVGVGARKSET